MVDLNTLSDWELFEYLREQKKWCLLPAGSKEDIQDEFELQLTDDEWLQFLRRVDKSQYVIDQYIHAMYHGILSAMDLECDLVESK